MSTKPAIGMTLGQHVAVPVTKLYPEELDKLLPVATAIRPIEKFLVPAALDGRAGQYRQPQAQCLLSARNDYDALLAWLRSKRGLSPEAQAEKRARRRTAMHRDASDPQAWLDVLSDTQRAARKEAERFLLWTILERNKPISSVTVEDCIAYREFIADPPPDWCGPSGTKRWSPLWRPFVGPLSASAQQYAVVMLKNLYNFLVSQNYLMGNPWTGIALPNGGYGQHSVVSRSFTERQWSFIGKQLEQQLSHSNNPEKGLRLLFSITFLYATGLRRSEAVRAQVKHLQFVEYPATGSDETETKGWELTVVGKRGKVREVIVPSTVIELLRRYLKNRGLNKKIDALENAEQFLIAPLTQRASLVEPFGDSVGDDEGERGGLAPETLYAMLKTFFVQCGQALASDGKSGSGKFMNASTHWLRHTNASHGVARGIPLEVVQGLLGHASLSTTNIYVTTEKARRMSAVHGAWS